MYVVFEGIDGSGKTSLIEELSKDEDLLKYKPIIKKEPFDESFIENSFKKIENLNEKNKALCLTLAFAYDRVFLEEKYKTFYEKNLVLSDRSFISSLAYQSIYIDLEWVYCVNKFFRKPDLVVFLDVEVNTAINRIVKRADKRISYFEKKEFLEKLKKSYKKVIDFLHKKNYEIVIIDANKKFEIVKEDVKNILLDNLSKYYF